MLSGALQPGVPVGGACLWTALWAPVHPGFWGQPSPPLPHLGLERGFAVSIVLGLHVLICSLPEELWALASQEDLPGECV